MKLLIILICSFPIYCLGGQQYQLGIVIDSETKQPISFATIFNITKKIGSYSTNEGIFQIEAHISDDVRVSCVGYIPKIFKATNIQIDTVYLSAFVKELESVTISAIDWDKYKKLNIGYSEYPSRLHAAAFPGKEYAIYIPNKTNFTENFIYGLKFKLKETQNAVTAVRIHLYSVGLNGQPGEELLYNNIIEIVKGNIDKVISVVISSEKILFPPNGVFVGLEWLGNYDTKTSTILFQKAVGPMFGFNFKLKDQQTWERIPGNQWQVADLKQLFRAAPFYDKLLKENVPNASFGITLMVK